jgi:hypothetical protein
MSRLKQIGEWFDERLLGGVIRESIEHPVPSKTGSWWYVFGSAALTIFGLQVVTSILLALNCVPSVAEAWNSLEYLNRNVTLGWYVPAGHGWGSNFKLAVVLIHIGGSGGLRGPAFDSVANTMTRDQLVRQVIQGGGNVSAYGKNLNPAEVTALVSFLETLHPAGRPPDRDASLSAMQQTEPTPASSH